MTDALRTAIVFAAALLLLVGSADAKVGWSEWLTASAYHTEHFRVLYQSDQTRQAYAKTVGDYIEAARNKMFGDLGYKEPSWLEGTKLDVYVTDTTFDDRRGFKPLGVTHGNIRNLDDLVGERVLFNPWIEIDLERFVWANAANAAQREHVLKALVAHEFFHVVQYGYDIDERPWLMEATATWVEDKVFEPPRELWEWTGWAERFGGWEGNRTDISTLSSQGSNEYAAAVFFQYLSERRPGSVSIVRRIWEEAAKQRGHNTYRAIAAALGESSPWGRNMSARIGDFAVATLIQSPSLNSTYSFRKREQAKDDYVDDLHPVISEEERFEMGGIALRSLNADRILTKTLSLKPFQVGYYEIRPPRSAISSIRDVKEDANVGTLIVLARGKSHRNWDFRLVEVPRREKDSDPVEKWTVRRLPRLPSRDQWVREEVENFPRKRVFLVAVNTEAVERDEEIGPGETLAPLSADEFEIAAVIVAPPVVTSFTVDVTEGNWYSDDWRAVWKVVREPSSRPGTWRTRTILTEGLTYEANDPKRVRFRLRTSRPILSSPTLTVGGQAISLQPDFGAKVYFGRDFKSYYTDFVAEEQITVFQDATERLDAGENVVQMDISVNGRDSWSGWFDENVSTAPRLAIRDDGRLFVERWEGERAGPGGKDKLSGRKLPMHQLSPSSYLAKLEARQNGSLIYQAEWRPDASREGARQLDVKVSKAYDPEAAMTVSLSFTEPVVDLRVRLASAKRAYYPDGYIASIPSPRWAGATDYTTTVPPSQEVNEILEEDAQLAFYIDAKRMDGPKIDGDPRTAAWYDWDDSRWYALEEGSKYGGHTNAGGTDDWHKLNAEGQSIVLLLDASGSMEEHGRMPVAKRGIAQAVANFKATDEVALIVFYTCGDIRIVVPFTQNAEEIVEAVQGVEPSGNTPLGDAIRFANAYLQRAARFQKRKLLTFSDGMTTCGASAATAVAELELEGPETEPEEPEEETPKEVRWTVYRVGTHSRPSLPDYWVEDIEYRESDYEDNAKDRARLTVRRYPVSYMSSRGRIVWSINWSRPRQRDRRTAAGPEVPALRARAEAQREGTMEKSRVPDAMRRMIGPGAVALRRSQ